MWQAASNVPLTTYTALLYLNYMRNASTTAGAKVKVVCNECGRTWAVSPNARSLECAKCGGADIDVRE